MTIEYRIATAADLPQIADLRWRLRVGDAPISDPAAHDRFVAVFIRICTGEWRSDEIAHWIAADGGHVLAVMSVAIVRKLPSPENLHGRWGYISNSYVLPEARNAGIGQQLLAAIQAWARQEDLELLLVWPSERAYPFYERAGFSRPPDPLIFRLRSE
jgi:GNAT superfamily N-acetyltransferase